jgi:hypothetical protein
LQPQQVLPFLGSTGITAVPAPAIDAHCYTDNSSTSVTSTSCALSNVTAGDAIWVIVTDNGSTNYLNISVGDGGDSFQLIIGPARDPGHNVLNEGWLAENVAGGSSVTVTSSWGGTSYKYTRIEAWALKNVPTKYVWDGNMVASAYGTSTSPAANSSNLTPANNYELLAEYLYAASGTITKGTNYSLVDGSSNSYGSTGYAYWSQTTATGDNGAWSNSANAGYFASLISFAPALTGSCDSTGLINWQGGTDTGSITAANLASGTFGLNPQPNAERLSRQPGWVTGIGGGSATPVYSAASYQPLYTSMNCAGFAGTGTGPTGHQVGVALTLTGGNVGESGPRLYILSTQTNASIIFPLWFTNGSNSSVFNVDSVAIGGALTLGTGNTDYANLNIVGNGTSIVATLEAPGGNSGTLTVDYNYCYVYIIKFVTAGVHTIKVYKAATVATTGCAEPLSSMTLAGTLTASGSVSGGGNPSYIGVFSQGSMSSTSGIVARVGDVKPDLDLGASSVW